jgi:hypothetical protein
MMLNMRKYLGIAAILCFASTGIEAARVISRNVYVQLSNQCSHARELLSFIKKTSPNSYICQKAYLLLVIYMCDAGRLLWECVLGKDLNSAVAGSPIWSILLRKIRNAINLGDGMEGISGTLVKNPSVNKELQKIMESMEDSDVRLVSSIILFTLRGRPSDDVITPLRGRNDSFSKNIVQIYDALTEAKTVILDDMPPMHTSVEFCSGLRGGERDRPDGNGRDGNVEEGRGRPQGEDRQQGGGERRGGERDRQVGDRPRHVTDQDGNGYGNDAKHEINRQQGGERDRPVGDRLRHVTDQDGNGHGNDAKYEINRQRGGERDRQVRDRPRHVTDQDGNGHGNDAKDEKNRQQGGERDRQVGDRPRHVTDQDGNGYGNDAKHEINRQQGGRDRQPGGEINRDGNRTRDVESQHGNVQGNGAKYEINRQQGERDRQQGGGNSIRVMVDGQRVDVRNNMSIVIQ